MGLRMLLVAGLAPALMGLSGCQSVERFAGSTSGAQRSASIDEFLGTEHINSRTRNEEVDTILYGKPK